MRSTGARLHLCGLPLLVLGLAACHGSSAPATDCGAITAATRFPDGNVDGHPDPAGAAAAHQARAGRITDAAMIHSPADVRFPVRVGDYLLANEKIALYIEAARPSDGYNPFGGEIAAIETVGPDGLPVGVSEWGEAFFSAGGMVVAPEKVTVLADGADGGPAIVRSEGTLKVAPFLEGYSFLFGDTHAFPAALDYVLAPGAEKVTLHLSIQNIEPSPVNLAAAQIVAFLMNRSATFTTTSGFALLSGNAPWVGWEAGTHAVAGRVAAGHAFNYLAAVEGAQIFLSDGATMDACKPVDFDYVELIAASPGIDALREAVRRVEGEPAWRSITGTVKDSAGAPVPAAYVHATLADGTYLTRAITGSDGAFAMHLPADGVSLSVTARGLPSPTPMAITSAMSDVALTAGALGRISVVATETGSGLALPVRIQVIPMTAPAPIPDSFGADDAGNGRTHLVFAVDGKTTVPVVAGTYRVVVSRGYEYELFDQMVTVAAGQTVAVTPSLLRSVDTSGALSADLHIHAYYSLDSGDPVDYKVRGALAEGLEIPVSSEHEYVFDFQPIVEQLGATAWAQGMSSEEMSTSTYGHFGLVPLSAKPDEVNRGALVWAGKHPPEIFADVRKLADDPALVMNHPYSKTAYKGYLYDIGFDLTTASADPTDWSPNFDAMEVFNNSDFEANRDQSVAAWFSLLNHGKIVGATGASDNHKQTGDPIGYPRTYFLVGTDDPAQLTPTQLRDAIRAGHSTISGGLYMTVRGPNGVGPGEVVLGGHTGTISFDVVVECPSWTSAQTLEVIVDGATTQTLDLSPSVTAGPGLRYETTVDVTADGTPHFVVFHASSPGVDLAPVHPGKAPFAVSNPIWF